MPKLSIIVPVYKVEPYIHKCVDSILNQTFTDFELILVDDGSPDNCGKICDEYAEKDNRVRAIHKENGGVSDARNVGIDKAMGAIVGFVDSDDYLDPNMYYDMLKFMDDNRLDIVCSDTYIVRGDRKKYHPRYAQNIIYETGKAIIENLNGNLDNAVWNKIYKKSVFSNDRFPLGRRYEDVAVIYKWIFNAQKVGYLSAPYYYYRKTKSSFIGQSFNSQSRYECFIGYKERLDFAIEKELSCVNACRAQALSTALSTLTAFYANNESKNSDRYIDVEKFIEDNQGKEIASLKRKDKILLWSFNDCKILHKIYSRLSSLAKRI